MGSVCSCFSVPDEEETEGSNGSAARHGNCCCPSCLIHVLVNKCGALFGRRERILVPSSDPVATSSSLAVATSSSSAVVTSSSSAVGTPSNSAVTTPSNSAVTTPSSSVVDPINSSELNRIPDRAVTNTSNFARSEIQQDVIVIRQDKGSSHSCVVLEPGSDADFQVKDRDNHVKEGSKVCCSKPSMKVLPLNEESAIAYALSSFEDEDVCPTCLEEYTPENPKITASCSHHYHLGCIYEWLERSETCPICGKIVSDEVPLGKRRPGKKATEKSK